MKPTRQLHDLGQSLWQLTCNSPYIVSGSQRVGLLVYVR